MDLIANLKLLLFKRHRDKAELNMAGAVDRILNIEGNQVAVGKFTYGVQNISLAYHQGCPALTIGRYCSIAGNVRIFLGAEHRHDWITTFPFGSQHQDVFGAFVTPGYPKSNGPVSIGSDVWIGNSVTIMSGVKIGDGAVIAAGAHVVKNVSPYEIVGGNPARHIKYRFSPEVINRLMKIRWWEFPDGEVRNIAARLCSQPETGVLDELMAIREKMTIGQT